MVLSSILGLLALLMVSTYLTNPANRFTIVRRPFVAKLVDGTIHAIDNNRRLRVNQFPLIKLFAVLKNGLHILSSRWIISPRSKSTTVQRVIDDIHRLRFNPNKLLLTTGDHFSALFVRNLGVFYYPTLDRAIPGTVEQWHNRQTTYLQTVAWALGVFAKQHTLTTTIVPTGRYQVTCVSFYAYPSDTLYGMLYAIAALLGKEDARASTYAPAQHHLDTTSAASILMETYGGSLTQHYHAYRRTVFDEQVGLIRTNIHLSGAKDITRRRSAFFDNVIFWKTTELAMTLGLIETDKPFLRALKRRILKAFWLEQQGHFLEDLSPEGLDGHYYSSDWLIVLATGFLSPEKQRERHYFERSVQYIRDRDIAKPFAIKYQHDTRAHRQFLAVRIAVASYGGDAIWSFWGMEYIKVLMLLHKTSDDTSYLREADRNIKHYKQNMLRDNGFPEVYDNQGRLLETPFYRSVRQAGWVIGFEQVLAMRRAMQPSDKRP